MLEYDLGNFKNILSSRPGYTDTYFLGLIHALVDPTQASSLSAAQAMMTYRYAPLTTAFIPVEIVARPQSSIYVSNAQTKYKADLGRPPRLSRAVRGYAYCGYCRPPVKVVLQHTTHNTVNAFTLPCLLRCLHACQFGTQYENLLNDNIIKDLIGREDIKLIAITDKNQVLYRDVISALLTSRFEGETSSSL